MATRLQSAVRQYRFQQELTRLGLAQADRSWGNRNFSVLVALLIYLQREAAVGAFASVDEMLQEQSVEAPLAAAPVASALAGWTSAGVPMESMITAFQSLTDLYQAVVTQIADTGRIAQGISIAARPQLDGYVRYLNPPSCARCSVLAGRFYPYSIGFLRHENCDCIMQPVTEEMADGLIDDPMDLFKRGLIKGLTGAEIEAINEGADIAQVVNIRRKSAGLRVAGHVLERGGRLTPEGIYRLASDRSEVLSLLIRNGYLAA